MVIMITSLALYTVDREVWTFNIKIQLLCFAIVHIGHMLYVWV